MENLKDTLRKEFKGRGHFLISIEVNGDRMKALTTNTMAIDAAFDENYDDYQNEARYYETREEAQQALVAEILSKNEIEF